MANALANILAFQLSSGARQKIAIYKQQSDSDDVGIKLVNEALARSDLSTTEKILLQGRLQTLQSDKTLNAQLLIAAKTVEAARIDHAGGGREVVRSQPPQLHRRRCADRIDPRRHRGAALGAGHVMRRRER